jgi:hypothetical protein
VPPHDVHVDLVGSSPFLVGHQHSPVSQGTASCQFLHPLEAHPRNPLCSRLPT